MTCNRQTNKTGKWSSRGRQRRGAATVEFAVTLPILIIFLFATFELGRGNMMRNTTEAAAYEAARIAIIPGATADEAEQGARTILATAGIQDADFAITPTNLETDSESVSITVTVNYEQNSIFPANFLGGANFVRTCVLNRE